MLAGADDADVQQGRGGCPDLVPDLLGGGPVGPIVWVGYVGDDPSVLVGCWADSSTGWPAV